MKYSIKIITVLSLMVFALFSCQPRIDLDEGQWGDHAFIEEVLIFIIEEEEHELQEYYENGETTTGIRRQFLNTSSDISDDESSLTGSVVVTVPNGTDLSNIGIVIRHTAKSVEPLNGSPEAGYLNDFSGGPFSYRIVSADGTERDYTVTIEIDG